MSPEAYISLGSNIEPEKNLVKAVQLLAHYGTILRVSAVYQTPPQGFAEQADFLNMAVLIQTDYSLEDFKTIVLGRIEQALGRVRDPNNKNAPRTIDLDISLWGAEIAHYGSKPWQVPDPDLLRFAHVGLPLADLNAAYLHPVTGQTLAEIARQFDESAFIQRRDIDFGDLSHSPDQA